MKRFVQDIVYRFVAKMVLIIYGKPEVKSSLETLDYILKNNCSVARFGDGEFDIINGKSIKFQKFDVNLSNKLSSALKSKSNNNCIICIPDIYNYSTIKKLKIDSRVFWYRYIIFNHKKLSKLFNLNNVYYDACVTRPYIRYNYKYNQISDELFSKIKEIWNKKDILIVEGETSRLGLNNDLFNNAKSLKRIICPSKSAYSKYDDIVSSIIKNFDNRLVLISLGPTATIMAKDLSDRGIRAIDLGHIDLEYEWYVQRATEKIPIKNKSVNEINNNAEIKDVDDSVYIESIIDRI